MAIAFVQVANGGLSQANIAYGSPNTAGNTLILVMRTSTGQAVSDTQGNNWALAGQNNVGTVYQIWHAFNCKAGANTVNATSASDMSIFEYSGIGGMDLVLPITASGSGTTYTSNAITPASVNNMVFTMFGNSTSNGVSVSAVTGGFINRSNAGSNTFAFELIQSSATTATAGCTMSNCTWGGVAVVYTPTVTHFPCMRQSRASNSNGLLYQVPNVAGNMLVCMARISGGGTPACTDTQGNTWLIAGTGTAGAAKETLFYVLNCKGGANTVTASGTGTVWIAIAEYTDVNTIGQTNFTGTNSAVFSVGPVTPAAAVSLVIAGTANESATNPVYSALAPSGTVQLPTAGVDPALFELRRITAAATTISANINSSISWGGVIAVFYFSNLGLGVVAAQLSGVMW